jgi:hypothetical protein
MTMASIFKRCDGPERTCKAHPHPWVVRYRTPGRRAKIRFQKSLMRATSP